MVSNHILQGVQSHLTNNLIIYIKKRLREGKTLGLYYVFEIVYV